MIRRFWLLAHRVPVRGEFTLNDLAGGGGRMDEVARSVSTLLTASNALRRDTELTILFVAEPPPASRKVRIEAHRVRYLNPDERSTAALLKNALIRSTRMDHDVESSPGFIAGPVDPEAEIRRFAARPGAYWLEEGGRPIRAEPLPREEVAFLLSDASDPTPGERAILESASVPRLSVGPRSLRASQVLDLVQNELDLREAAPFPP